MLRKILPIALCLTPLAVVACRDALAPDPGLPALSVAFQSGAGHLHIWETPATYTARVTTNATPSALVTNFDTLRVEFAAVGTVAWLKLGDLTLQSGGSYSGTMYWPSAGTFNYRLVGHRPDQTGNQVLAAPTTSAAPVRQHYDAGTSWRVEFEPSPGLNKPGDTITMKFYVMERTADAQGVRQPIGGITGVTITCINPGAATGTDKVAIEAATGRYEAQCTVPMDGWAKAKISFTAPSGAVSATANYGVGTVTGTPS